MATLTSPTAQQLLRNVRTLLSQPDPLNSTWTDPELVEYLNEGVRIYFQEAASANEGYFTTTTDLDIVSNSNTITLPSDFFQAKILWKKVTNGYIALNYRNMIQDSYSTIGGTSTNTYLPVYEFRGNSLVLSPTPNFSETGGLKLEYIQFPDTMVYGGDSMTSQVSPVFKQMIEMYAVYKAKLKESMVNGTDLHSVPESNLNKLYTLFKASIQKRSKGPTFVSSFNPETES